MRMPLTNNEGMNAKRMILSTSLCIALLGCQQQASTPGTTGSDTSLIQEAEAKRSKPAEQVTWASRFPTLWATAYADSAIQPADVSYERFVADVAARMRHDASRKSVFSQLDYWMDEFMELDTLSSPWPLSAAHQAEVAKIASQLRPLLTTHAGRTHLVRHLTHLIGDGYVVPELGGKLQFLYPLLTDMYGKPAIRRDYAKDYIEAAIHQPNPFIHEAYHPDSLTGLVTIDKTSREDVDYYLDQLILFAQRDFGHAPDDEAFGPSKHLSQHSRLCYLAKYALQSVGSVASASKRAQLTSAFAGRTASSVGYAWMPRCTSIQ